MKNIYFTILSLLFAISVNAQLINDGAAIIVEDGATLFIEGSLQNNLTGSIDIQGTGIVEVEGDVTNAGTATISMSNTAKLILSGANPTNFTSGGASFTNIEMDKTANTVSLLDEMRITTNLNFVGNDNQILIGNNDLVFAPAATITSADLNEYIVADGNATTGVVSKELSADELFVFEIGDATNYTPLSADVSGTVYTSATVDVNVVPMVQSNKPAEATDYISRYWNVDQTGVTTFSADLIGTYVPGDLMGTAGDVKGAHYGSVSTDWSYVAAAAGANFASGTIAESGDYTGTNAFGRVDMKVFLQGAYSGGTMTTALNSILPLTSPYAASPDIVASIPNADIVDWVLLEVRDSGTPGTVISSNSAFLKSDGTIVALDGVSNPYLKDAPASAFVVITHRNHMQVETNVAIALVNPVFKDMSDISNVYVDGGISNPAMKDMGGSVYALWSGDVNSNGVVSYNGGSNDRTPILVKVGFLTPNNTVAGYFPEDVNMNATVSYNGGSNDRTPILVNVGFLTPNNILEIHKNY